MRSQLDLLLINHSTLLIRTAEAALGTRIAEFNGLGDALSSDDHLLGREFQTLSHSAKSSQSTSSSFRLLDSAFLDYVKAIYKGDPQAAGTALQSLNKSYTQPLQALLTSLSNLPPNQIADLLHQQTTALQTVADLLNQKSAWSSVYDAWHTLNSKNQALGDTLAIALASHQPGRFPGNPNSPTASRQLQLILATNEQVNLIDFAAAAAVDDRRYELTGTSRAIAKNQNNFTEISTLNWSQLADAVANAAVAISTDKSPDQNKITSLLTASFPKRQKLASRLGQALKELAQAEGSKKYPAIPATLNKAEYRATELSQNLIEARE